MRLRMVAWALGLGACNETAGSAPVCTFTPAPPATVTLGSTVTLEATCTNGPTSYAWSTTQGKLGTGACNSGATCSDEQATPTTVTYSLTASNGQPSAPISATVDWVAGTGAPSSCAITAVPTSLPINGGPVSLSVACGGGAPLTTFAWSATGSGCSSTFGNPTTPIATDTLPPNSGTSATGCTYTATVGNGTAPTAAPSLLVPVAAPPTVIDCKAAGVLGITGPTIVYDVPWVVDSGNADHTGNGTIPDMQPGMAWVGVVHVPPTAPANPSNTGRMDIHEYPDAPYMRWVTVTTTPCTWGQPGDGSATLFNLGPSFLFTIGPNSLGSAVLQFVAGGTYYVNLRMQKPTNPTGNTCGGTTCNFVLEFFKPNGT